jgi:hypothetical protein
MVTNSQYPNDRPPVSNTSSVNYPAMYEQNLLVVGATVTSNDGTVSGIVGKKLRYVRDTQSRYWFAAPQSFTFNPKNGIGPGTYTFKVKVEYKTIKTYHKYGAAGTSRCRNSGDGNVKYNDFSSCVVYSKTFSYKYTIASPPTVSCAGMSTDPAYLNPFVPFRVTASFSSPSAITADSITVSINGPSPSTTSRYSASFTPAVSASGSTRYYRATSSSIGGLAGGNYTVRYVLSYTGSAGAATKTCTATLSIAYFPYLAIYGGDVVAGNSPVVDATGNPSCAADSTAGFETWNNGGPDFTGAGVQIAAYALGAINYFATGQNGGSVPPSSLAFANTSTAVATGNYGGGLGMTFGQCDYTSTIGDAGESVQERSGNYDLSSQSLVDGARQTIHVKGGNVYLSGNILYTNTSWTDVRQIPNFKLIVEGGDIYIDHTVSSLNGMYVAIPKAGVGGTIYTCTNGHDQYIATAPVYYNDCNRQLTIFGSFVAKKVYYQRTYGSVAQAANRQTYTNSKAAEVFVYTPELWLPRTYSTNLTGAVSITSLAPIL